MRDLISLLLDFTTYIHFNKLEWWGTEKNSISSPDEEEKNIVLAGLFGFYVTFIVDSNRMDGMLVESLRNYHSY